MFGEGYASIYAKVKSWMPVLLQEQDMEEVGRLNLKELLDYFKARTKKITIDTEDATEVEALLKHEGFYFLQSGVRFLSGSAKEFVNFWARYYEIENLKTITRSLLNNKPIGSLFYPGAYSKLQHDLVKDLKSLDELQDYLSGTEYYRLAQDSLPRVKEEKDTFYFEMNLDNYYAQSLKKKSASLSYADKKEVRNVLFYHLELFRILWIFRAKFNYKMSSEQVISILPNIFNILSPAQYTQLVETDNEETFVSNLKAWHLVEAESSANLEQAVRQSLTQRAVKHINGNPFNLGVFLGFMLLHTIHLYNVTVLIESKKLGIGVDRLSEYLLFRK